MFLSQAVLAVLALQLSIVSAASNACANPIYSVLVNPLKTYAPAQAYCTKYFPVAPIPTTTTVRQDATTGITITVTATQTGRESVVDTTTTTEDVGDATTTVFDTTTSYTSTATVTTCSTGGVNNKARRMAAPAPANTNLSASLSKLQKAAASYVKTVCSCIEAQRTTTITITAGGTTRTDLATVTATAKQTVTDRSTLTVTITQTRVASTKTETRTINTDTTTTVQSCAPPSPSPGTCTANNCYRAAGATNAFAVSCNQFHGDPNAPALSVQQGSNIYDCLSACDSRSDCIAVNFNRAVRICALVRSGQSGSTDVTPDNDLDTAIKKDPSCAA